jgi:hypothetical protein
MGRFTKTTELPLRFPPKIEHCHHPSRRSTAACITALQLIRFIEAILALLLQHALLLARRRPAAQLLERLIVLLMLGIKVILRQAGVIGQARRHDGHVVLIVIIVISIVVVVAAALWRDGARSRGGHLHGLRDWLAVHERALEEAGDGGVGGGARGAA